MPPTPPTGRPARLPGERPGPPDAAAGPVAPPWPTLPPGFVLGTAAVWPADGGCLEQDAALLARLGARGHRFALSWSRLVPDGRGAPDPAGLDHYDRLLDALLCAGVAPVVTLLHGELPAALAADGGWLNRATVEAFADLATLAGERFGDRVAHWVPVDQPNVVTLSGHGRAPHESGHEPGHESIFDLLPVAHHLLLAHGRAVVALRAAGARSVGCANNHAPMWPATADAADVGATKLFDAVWNGLFLEPMLLGHYPADLAPLLVDVVAPGDLAVVRQPLDFYGVNYFHPFKVGAAAEGAPLPFELLELLGYPVTDLGWPVVPSALREWLITFRARFRAALPPLVVTASGCSYDDRPDADGVVDDPARIDYLATHLQAVGEAVQRGVDVRGFYAWSLLDDDEHFGLVHVDAATQARTPKSSFTWYADLVARQPRSVG